MMEEAQISASLHRWPLIQSSVRRANEGASSALELRPRPPPADSRSQSTTLPLALLSHVDTLYSDSVTGLTTSARRFGAAAAATPTSLAVRWSAEESRNDDARREVELHDPAHVLEIEKQRLTSCRPGCHGGRCRRLLRWPGF